MEAARLTTMPAVKAVSRGIQVIQDRLKVAGDGKPRLFVFRNCTVEHDARLDAEHRPMSTLEEFTAYIWNDKQAKDAPVKLNDHGLDAARYGAMYLEEGGGASLGIAEMRYGR